MKKKVMVFLLTSTMLASVLAGCSSGEKDSGDTNKTDTEQRDTQKDTEDKEEVSKGEQEEVVITIGEHVANIEQQSPHVALIVEKFQETYPNIKIDINGAEVEEHLTKMKLAAQNDNLPDIIWLEQPIAKEMAAAGYLYDMTDALNEYGINDYFLPGLVNSCTVDGKDYGLPSEIMMVGFFYNKSVFEENNVEVPTTFEEFMSVIETLKGNGATPIAIGAKSNFSVWAFQSMLTRYGFFEKLDGLESGEISWVNDDFIKFFEKVEQMAQAGAFSENAATIDYFEAKEIFLGGNAAMFNSGAWDIAAFEESDIADQIGFFWGPTFTDGAGTQEQAIKTSGGVYTISQKASEDPVKLDAIMKFFEFYYGKTGTKIIAEDTKGLPTTSYDGAVDAQKNPVFSEMLIRLNDDWASVKEPFSSLSTNVGNTLFDAIFGVINGIYSPEEACQVVEDAMALER